jgi:hypothetical protein
MIQSKVTVFALSASVFSTALIGCGKEEAKYEPVPAVSGISVKLPDVPTVAEKPIKEGDAYTVWGASYYQRNRVHQKEVVDQRISIVGYITKTNLADAPECAVHETGKGDPEGCKAPIPTFWIGDTKDAPENETMKVMGWASNFANIYSAIEEFDKLKEDEKPEYSDGTWGVAPPYPLPVKGAKVKISGDYSTEFTQASAGLVSDPIMGVLSYKSLEYLETVEELAILPGMKPRKPLNKK